MSTDDDDPLLLAPRPSKRRRIQSSAHTVNGSDYIVETSDPDEREELAPAARADYWGFRSVRHNISFRSTRPPSPSPHTMSQPTEPTPPPFPIPPRSLPSPLPSSLPVTPLRLSRHSSFSSTLSPPPTSPGSPLNNRNLPQRTSERSDHENEHDHELRELPAPRLLRRRNQLQLNPYTLEKLRYQNMMKQGGQKEAIVRTNEKIRHSPQLGDEDDEWISRANDDGESQEFTHHAASLSPPAPLERVDYARQQPFPMRRPRRRSTTPFNVVATTHNHINTLNHRTPRIQNPTSKSPLESHPQPPYSDLNWSPNEISDASPFGDVDAASRRASSSSALYKGRRPFNRSRSSSRLEFPSSPPSPAEAHHNVIELTSSEDDRARSSPSEGSYMASRQLSRKERRQKRARDRMMPAFMAKQHEQAQMEADATLHRTDKPRPRRRLSSTSSSDTRIVRPGQAFVRVTSKHLGPLVIRGDPESPESVTEPPPGLPFSPSSSSFSEDDDISGDSYEEDDFGSVLEQSPKHVRKEDLIDRMLSRNRRATGDVNTRLRSAPLRRKKSFKANGLVYVVPGAIIPHPTGTTVRTRQTRLPFLPAMDDAGHRPSFLSSHAMIADQKHRLPRARSGRKMLRHHRGIDFEDDDQLHAALTPMKTSSPSKARPPSMPEARQGSVLSKPTLPIEAPITDPALRRVSVDFGIPFLQLGQLSLLSPYLQGTRLIQLLELESKPMCQAPWTYDHFGVNLPQCQDSPMFVRVLPILCDRLFDWSTGAIDDPDGEKKALQMIVSACQMVTWILLQEGQTERDTNDMIVGVYSSTSHLIDRVSNWVLQHDLVDRSLGHRTIWLLWLSFETSLRIVLYRRTTNNPDVEAPLDVPETSRFLDLMIARLLRIGLYSTIKPLVTWQEAPSPWPIKGHSIEIWICIIHVVQVYGSPTIGNHDEFWQRVEKGLLHPFILPKSDFEKGEHIWRTLFSLSMLSQFSTLGSVTPNPSLLAHWELVSRALSCVRLVADDKTDKELSSTVIAKRDSVIRCILARCVLLATRWRWNLSIPALDMFSSLCDIFRSRRFANLTLEPPNFPLFITDMRDSSRGLSRDNLDEIDEHDAAYDLLLKLVVRASKDLEREFGEGGAHKHVRKLLSMAVPVGSAQFTPENPPVGGDLSMLYNRYSSSIVALSLTPQTLKARIQQAQRYSVFARADWKSRHTSILALMYFTIWTISRSLSLVDVLPWLSSMSSCLLSELRAVDALIKTDRTHPRAHGDREHVVVAIQLLFGSLRCALDSQKVGGISGYPDPMIFQPSWLSQIFDTSLLDDRHTGEEIRRFIQAFLDARTRALPAPRRPILAPLQESQDEFGDLDDIDLDDPEVIAAMEGRELQPHPTQEMDKASALIILQTISPVIYRLIDNHLAPVNEMTAHPNRSIAETEQWIRCWVGCACVLVQNRLRDWSHYFQFGNESWPRMIHHNGGRDIGLYFMSMVLDLDPMAYKSHKDQFIKMWFGSIVALQFTIQHHYTSRLFTLDGLRHPLFRNLPCTPDDGTNDFHLQRENLLELRLTLIEHIIGNLEMSVQSEPAGDTRVQIQNEAGRTGLIEMLGSMQETLQSLPAGDVRRVPYVSLCQSVVSTVQACGVLGKRGEALCDNILRDST